MSSQKFPNKRKKIKVEQLSNQIFPTKESLDSCKFNFHYLCKNGHKCADPTYWEANKLFSSHFDKLKDYSNYSLAQLMQRDIGKGSKILKYLQDKTKQPEHAELHMPINIPSMAKWAEIRFGGAQRLIGFIFPGELHGKKLPGIDSKFTIDRNTFYVVFFDGDHKFWPITK
jgi:hypothetical protein